MICRKKIEKMVSYANETVATIEVNWSSVDVKCIAGGSPVDASGRLANDGTAVGVLLDTIYYGDKTANVIVAGDVDLDAVLGATGIVVSEEAKSACRGIRWRTKNYVIEQDEKVGGVGGVVITVSENETVNGYQVPKMNADDVLRAYNAVVAAKPCTLTDANEHQHFAVNQADTVTDAICVNVLYYDKMLLTYVLSGDTVEIEHTEI